MVPRKTSIIAQQDAVVFVTYKVTMATVKPCKNTLYFGFTCSYLKNELGDPIFLLHKSDQQAKMKLYAKFKIILWSGFRAILNFQLFKVALNPLHIILFALCRKVYSGMLIKLQK